LDQKYWFEINPKVLPGICWWGDSLCKMIRTFPELQRKFYFRKIGEYQIDPDNQISYARKDKGTEGLY
jgi:hypothetical protein